MPRTLLAVTVMTSSVDAVKLSENLQSMTIASWEEDVDVEGDWDIVTR